MDERYYDLAASVQQALEVAISRLIESLIVEYGTKDFLLAASCSIALPMLE
jgi:hypothetical protein